MNRRALIVFVLLSIIPIEIARGDSTNPPRVFGIKIVNEKAVYAPGDEIIYEIEYSGGNPGIKSLQYGLSPIASGTCVGTNNVLYWSESTAKSYSTTNVGPISNNIFRLTGTVTSDCRNGVNEFGLSFLSMTDKTDLKYEAFFRAPSFNVTDGRFIPPGTLLGNARAVTLSLDFLQSSYVIDENKPVLISLPKKNSDGILITYYAFYEDVCRIARDSSGYGSILEIVKSGTCEVQAKVVLTRSEFTNTQISKKIFISSQADAKAAADGLLTPPPTDVSCSISTAGVICSNSITITRTWNVTGSPSLDWYFALLKPAQDPNLSSSYGTRALQKKSNPGQVTDSQEFIYEKLLTFAGNNPEASVLITAIIVNGDGKFWPAVGKGTYVVLKDVKSEINKRAAEAKAAEAKLIADKAAAELKAKQEAETKAAELKAKQEAEAKAATEKVICDANRTELLSIQNTLLAAVKAYPKSANTLNDARLRLQSALTSSCIADVTLNDFKGEVLSVIAQAKTSVSTQKITITCVKGKLTKKITSAKPVCPNGYKKK